MLVISTKRFSRHLLFMLFSSVILFMWDINAVAHEGAMSSTFLTQPTNIEISGKVVNSDGIPLIGVSVYIKGAAIGSVTDKNGAYSLAVPDNEAMDTLVFSYTGYQTKQVAINGRTIINVILQHSVALLDQLVVIGFGKQKRLRTTSSIAEVSGKQLNDRPASRIDQALIGKMAGVKVQEVSGRPGTPFDIKVRGVHSISYSNAPLYVVDGFPVSDISMVSMEDVASISVLKDAAAAAIYGSRGANGVVLITTKTGKKGKPILELNAYYGVQKRFSKVDVMNRKQWIPFAIEERNNSWVLQGGDPSDPNSVRTHAYWIDPKWISDPTSLPDNDWQELVSRAAPVQNYQLSASGATDAVKYYLSGSYYNQEGIIIGTGYSRVNFLSNIEANIGKGISLGLNLAAGSSLSEKKSGDNLVISRSIWEPPVVGLHQQTVENGFYPYTASFYVNPLAWATELTDNYKTKKVRANFYTTIELLTNLKFRTSLGLIYRHSNNQYFKPNNINRAGGNRGSNSTSESENYLTKNTLTYDNNWGNLDVNLLAGFTYQKEKRFATSLAKDGAPDAVIRTLNASPNLLSGSTSASAWNLMSFIGRANLSYDNKYLLSASLRRDGSSRFGINNKWGWFPAVSLGWMISSEPFMKDIDVISHLKLRISDGLVGNNNIGNYSSIGSIGYANYVLGASEQKVVGVRPASFSNALLGWESTEKFDVGMNLGLFNNRIELGVDYYQANTKNLLLNIQIPSTSGFSNSIQNIGQVKNTGFEVELTTKNLVKEFKWNTSLNVSHNQNKVIKLGPDGSPIYRSYYSFIINKTQIGSPIGSYYMFIQDGVFMNQHDFDNNPHYKNQHVGDIKYKDVNQDGVIDNKDKRIVGNNNPKLYLGMRNSFSFKNFDLNFTVDGQWGAKLFDLSMSQAGQSRANVRTLWLNRWRSPQDPGNGKIPRAAVTDNLTTPSTFWLFSADYWRIGQVTLGYTFPHKIFDEDSYISSLRFYVNVTNVYMHDHYYHMPQTGSRSNTATSPGVDFNSTYPLARTLTFGLNIKF